MGWQLLAPTPPGGLLSLALLVVAVVADKAATEKKIRLKTIGQLKKILDEVGVKAPDGAGKDELKR